MPKELLGNLSLPQEYVLNSTAMLNLSTVINELQLFHREMSLFGSFLIMSRKMLR